MWHMAIIGLLTPNISFSQLILFDSLFQDIVGRGSAPDHKKATLDGTPVLRGAMALDTRLGV
jgi:hypothetical protein